MSLKQSEFYDQFTYQEPNLPDSVDSAIAFFCAVNYLIRSTPFEIAQRPELNKPRFATRLLDLLRKRIPGAVAERVGWVRRLRAAAPNTCKR